MSDSDSIITCGIPLPFRKNFHNLLGKRFRLLTVTAYAGIGRWGPQWLCACDCGGFIISRTEMLVQKKCGSCGCIRRVAYRPIRTHGDSMSPEHRTWKAMLSRCRNPNAINYKHYGGKGIRVCERWNLFENFLSDMGRKPTRSHSIDRIDRDRDYCPENCKWATQREQMRNMSRSTMVPWNGTMISLPEYCEREGLEYALVRNRLARGWALEKASIKKKFRTIKPRQSAR